MRSLFNRMLAPPAARAANGVPSSGMLSGLGSTQSASGLLVSQATAMSVSAVYACVKLVSRDVARCAASMYETEHDDSRTKVRDHPVARLLKRPNAVQTWFEFVRDLIVAYLLRGNAYAVIIRDFRGQPVALIPVNPDAVMVLEASDGSWFYNINRIGLWQMAVLRAFPSAIPAEDVFHFRDLSFNTLVGVSTIGLARDSIGLSMGLGLQQNRWIGNGARPSVVLKSPTKLTEEAATRLKSSWQQYNGGIMNTGGTAVLEEGVDVHQLQLTGVDLQLMEQLRLSIEDCCRFFSVPPRKIGVADTTRGSTISQEDQSYVNTTVAPILTLLEQRLEREFDLDLAGFEIDLDETPLLRADPLTRYNLGRIGKLSGLLTTAEWRRSERLAYIAGTDALMQPVNMAALGSDISGQAPDDAGRPPAGQGKNGTGNAQDEAPEG